MKASGTSRLTSEGRNTAPMIFSGVICPPIHSMVVVTSPITVQCAAGIGGDDDEGGEQQAVVALGDQPLHQRDHHDGGRDDCPGSR